MVFISCIATPIVSSAETEAKDAIKLPVNTGNRKVIFFEEGLNTSPSKQNIKTETNQSEEIEFIIGGQSQDGVAKRSQLKIKQ